MKGSESTLVSDQAYPAGAETPLAYRAVRGGLWVALSSYWTIGFGFIANIILTRLLSPEAFGTFALAMFFAQLLRLQPKLGLGYAFIQYKKTTGEALGTYFAMDIPITLSGLLLSLLAAPILLRLGYTSIVVQVSVVLALAAFLESIAGMGGMLLDKEMHFGQTSLIQSLAFPISYLPAFWLATHGGNVWSLVAQTITYNMFLLAGMWWIAHHQLPHIWQMRWLFSPSLACHFFRFGITVGITSLAALLVSQFDNFLVGTLIGLTALGFYDRAYRMSQWPALLLNAIISRAAFITYAKLQDDPARLQKTVAMVLWIIMVLALPLALVIFITAPDLLSLLYGDRWLPAALLLRLLMIASVAKPLWENAGTLLIAIGKPRSLAMFTFVQALILAAIGLPLTIFWQAPGTCVAVGLAYIIGVVLTHRALSREIARESGKMLLPSALASILTVLGYLALNRLSSLNDLGIALRLAIKSAYTLTAFFGFTFITQPDSTRERVRYVWELAMQGKKLS